MADVRKRRVATQGAWRASRDRLLSFVRRLSRRYVKVLPGFYKSRVWLDVFVMKSEKEVRDNIEMLKGIDEEDSGLVAAAIAALEWCLK